MRWVLGATVGLCLALAVSPVWAASGPIKLKLGRSYVGGIYPKETAAGTVTADAPLRWSFVRYGKGNSSKALYSIPSGAPGCVPQGELRVVGVQATGADPLSVARSHAFKGVIASGRTRDGAWAVVRYRTAPSAIKAWLGGVRVVRVAPNRLLTVQARLRSACELASADLDQIAGELGRAVRSVRSQVRVSTTATGRAAAIRRGDTRIALGREGVDGAGLERVAGKVLIHAPSSWTRTSHDTAPTARFTASVSGSCSAAIQISVRVVATGQTSRIRALRVTQASSDAVIADNSRPAGWLRIIRLAATDQSLRPVSYGIAIVRVEPNRWVDVRAFSSFADCTDEQIKNGSASKDLRTLLHDARVHARIIRR